MAGNVIASKSLFLLGLLFAALSSTQTASQQRLHQQLHARDPEITIKALKQIAATKSLFERPEVQSMVIHLLNSETMNPQWEELAENQQYEEFYGQLLSTVQVIAVQMHNRQAWLALAMANYNGDSAYGRWLAPSRRRCQL